MFSRPAPNRGGTPRDPLSGVAEPNQTHVAIGNATHRAGGVPTGEAAPNICFLLEDFHPIVHGASIQTILLAPRFMARGARVTVITRRLFEEHAVHEDHEGIQVFRVPPTVGVHRLGKYLMLFPAFMRLVRLRKQFDVLIVCDLKVLGICGVLAAKLLRKTCLLNAVSCGEMDGSYATVYEVEPPRLKVFAVKAFVAVRDLIVKRADNFVSISSALTDEFLRCGIPASKVSQIHYGVDTAKFRALAPADKVATRRRLDLPDGRCFIYTGRLITGKGLETLISVWRRLATEFDDITLLLVGSGQGYGLSCEDYLRDYVADHDLGDRVVFTGSVDNVCDYLQAADFFVFPSQSEGLGLSLIEALACELPSIATGVGGVLDILEHEKNGLLVRYGDEEELYAAMKNFLTDPERADLLAHAGRETVLQKFDVDRSAEAYLLLFRRLLSAANTIPPNRSDDLRDSIGPATSS